MPILHTPALYRNVSSSALVPWLSLHSMTLSHKEKRLWEVLTEIGKLTRSRTHKVDKIWTRCPPIRPRLGNVPDSVTSCHYRRSTNGRSVFLWLHNFSWLFMSHPFLLFVKLRHDFWLCVTRSVPSSNQTHIPRKSGDIKYCWWTSYCTKSKADS